jgi:Legionella pneumophila major outer membrane protein precursor
MRTALLSSIILLGTQLSALGSCGEFDLAIDYLYWKPAGVAQELGQVSKEVDGWDNCTRVIVDPTYQSGVRGELGWRPHCWPMALVARYSWVEPSHSQTFNGSSESIRVELETIYHAGDLFLTYQFCSWNRFRLELLAGGNFLYFAEVSKKTSSSGLSELHIRFAGGGGSVGVGGIWSLWCSLEAFAEARFGLLFGSRMDARVEVNSSATFLTPISNQEWTRELGLRLGGRHTWACSCGSLGLSLGWEARSYLDLFYSTQTIGQPQIARGKAMGGPFVGLVGKF